jgi:hypothetical protein
LQDNGASFASALFDNCSSPVMGCTHHCRLLTASHCSRKSEAASSCVTHNRCCFKRGMQHYCRHGGLQCTTGRP